MASQAAKDTNKKLTMERKLRPIIEFYNRQTLRAFVSQLGREGTLFDIHLRDEDLAGILLNHYRKTANMFSENLGIQATPAEEDEITIALFIFFETQSKEESVLINNTTNNNMVTSVDVARQDPLYTENPDNRTLAVIAGASLSRQLAGRVQSLLTSETQLAAESAKLTEAQVLAGVPPSVTGGSPRAAGVQKEWVTVGDDRVRASHIAADGQKVDINDPFIVQGQQLMVPRDRSRGATADNTINCRCDAVYDVEAIENLR